MGMPLASHLTAEFKSFFSPDRLRHFNQAWRQQGGGLSDCMLEEVISVLVRPDLPYESVLGFLEVQSKRPKQPNAQQYHHLYSKMVEIIYFMLYHRHLWSFEYARAGLVPFEGLAGLAASSQPLWVFSLNHDLALELVAHHCAIPLRDGFWPAKTVRILAGPPVKDDGGEPGSREPELPPVRTGRHKPIQAPRGP